nr:hypothetical protein CFP56_16819 [Quercus suber]
MQQAMENGKDDLGIGIVYECWEVEFLLHDNLPRDILSIYASIVVAADLILLLVSAQRSNLKQTSDGETPA